MTLVFPGIMEHKICAKTHREKGLSMNYKRHVIHIEDIEQTRHMGQEKARGLKHGMVKLASAMLMSVILSALVSPVADVIAVIAPHENMSVPRVSAADMGSVTVIFHVDGKPVINADFRIFLAAVWDDGSYKLVPPFSGYQVQIYDDPDSAKWRSLAETLSAYAARDNIQPAAETKTDDRGMLTYANLKDGLYLLVGDAAESGNEMIFPQPMLVTVPYENSDGSRDYGVVTEPKYDRQKLTGEPTRRGAVKIWKDEGNKAKRPQDVTVQLLCDGKVYDEQVLNAANNWSYTWNNLEASHDWQLAEKEVPEDYTVQVTREDMTFTITNTNDNPPPPPPEEPGLPQTGLLWWPVPVLAAGGACMLLSGIFIICRKRASGR